MIDDNDGLVRLCVPRGWYCNERSDEADTKCRWGVWRAGLVQVLSRLYSYRNGAALSPVSVLKLCPCRALIGT